MYDPPRRVVSDEEAAQAAQRLEARKRATAERLANVPAPPNPDQNQSALADMWTRVKQGAAEFPGMVGGIADIAAGGALTGLTPFSSLGNALGDASGFSAWKSGLEQELSPAAQEAKAGRERAWQEGGVGNIVGEYLKHPLQNVGGMVAEALPLTLASVATGGLAGVAGKGLQGARAASALARVSPGVAQAGAKLGRGLVKYAPGIGEGAVTAGYLANQMLDQGADPRAALSAAMAGGAVTGVIGQYGAKLSDALGVGNIESLSRAGQAGPQVGPQALREFAKKNPRTYRMGGGALVEGLAEEAPQSAQEQMWQNVGTGQPLTQGVARSAFEGALAGSAMGAGFNVPGPRDQRGVRQGQDVDLTRILERRNQHDAPITTPAQGAPATAAPAAPTWDGSLRNATELASLFGITPKKGEKQWKPGSKVNKRLEELGLVERVTDKDGKKSWQPTQLAIDSGVWDPTNGMDHRVAKYPVLAWNHAALAAFIDAANTEADPYAVRPDETPAQHAQRLTATNLSPPDIMQRSGATAEQMREIYQGAPAPTTEVQTDGKENANAPYERSVQQEAQSVREKASKGPEQARLLTTPEAVTPPPKSLTPEEEQTRAINKSGLGTPAHVFTLVDGSTIIPASFGAYGGDGMIATGDGNFVSTDLVATITDPNGKVIYQKAAPTTTPKAAPEPPPRAPIQPNAATPTDLTAPKAGTPAPVIETPEPTVAAPAPAEKTPLPDRWQFDPNAGLTTDAEPSGYELPIPKKKGTFAVDAKAPVQISEIPTRLDQLRRGEPVTVVKGAAPLVKKDKNLRSYPLADGSREIVSVFDPETKQWTGVPSDSRLVIGDVDDPIFELALDTVIAASPREWTKTPEARQALKAAVFASQRGETLDKIASELRSNHQTGLKDFSFETTDNWLKKIDEAYYSRLRQAGLRPTFSHETPGADPRLHGSGTVVNKRPTIEGTDQSEEVSTHADAPMELDTPPTLDSVEGSPLPADVSIMPEAQGDESYDDVLGADEEADNAWNGATGFLAANGQDAEQAGVGGAADAGSKSGRASKYILDQYITSAANSTTPRRLTREQAHAELRRWDPVFLSTYTSAVREVGHRRPQDPHERLIDLYNQFQARPLPQRQTKYGRDASGINPDNRLPPTAPVVAQRAEREWSRLAPEMGYTELDADAKAEWDAAFDYVETRRLPESERAIFLKKVSDALQSTVRSRSRGARPELPDTPRSDQELPAQTDAAGATAGEVHGRNDAGNGVPEPGLEGSGDQVAVATNRPLPVVAYKKRRSVAPETKPGEPSAAQRIAAQWEQAVAQDEARLDAVREFLLGGPMPPAPSVVYRGVPQGSRVRAPTSAPYEHTTPWKRVAAEAGQVSGAQVVDIVEYPAQPDQRYYRGGALAGDPLEATRVGSIRGYTWEQALNRTKTLYRRYIAQAEHANRELLSDPDYADVLRADIQQQALSQAVTDFRRGVYETDAVNRPGRWVGRKVPRRLHKNRPDLRTTDEIAEWDAKDPATQGPGASTETKSGETAAPAQPTSRAVLTQTLADLTGRTDHWRLHIYDTADEARASGIPDAKLSGTSGRGAYGWVETLNGVRHATLIAERIPPGKALGAFLHEVGVHLGMESILKSTELKNLYQSIERWAAKADDSLESKIAQAALARVEKAQAPDKQRQSEAIAYFVEEAVKAGVNPTAMSHRTALDRWLRTLWAAFKRALRALRLANLSRLSPQDFVDLAYGAARMELVENDATTKEFGAETGEQFGEPAEDDLWPAPPEQPSLTSNVSTFLQDLKTNTLDWVERVTPGLMNTAQLANRTRETVPQAEAFYLAQVAQQQFVQEHLDDAALLSQAIEQLSTDQANRLGIVMHAARRLKFNPEDDALPEDASPELRLLDRRYNALDSRTQDVAKALWTFWSTQFDEMLTVLDKVAEEVGEAGKAATQVKELLSKIPRHAYTPFVRLGNYYTVAMSQDYLDLLDKQDQDDGLSQADQKLLATLRKDPAHYQTQGHTTRAKALRAAEELQASGNYARVYDSVSTFKGEGASSPLSMVDALVERLSDGAEGATGEDLKAGIRSAVMAVAIEALPANHGLKRALRADDIEGEEKDLRKAFNAAASGRIHHMARLKFAKQISDTLQDLRKTITTLQRTEPDKARQMKIVQNSLLERAALAHQTDGTAWTPAVNRLVQMSYLAHLGVSPAFWLTQMTQMPLIALPWIGGHTKGGMTGATPALWKAMRDVRKLLKVKLEGGVFQSRVEWKDQLKDANGNPDTGAEAVMQALEARGLLAPMLHHDFGNVVVGANAKLDRFMRNLNAPSQIIEEVSRAATGLAAYRLKLEETQDQDKATQFAIDAVATTMFDYSPLGRAPKMQRVLGSRDLAKVAFQFRQHQQGMLFMLFSSMNDARKNSAATEEERAAARKTLLGVFGLMTAAGGVLAGTPFVSDVLGLVGGVLGILPAGLGGSDDDDPEDLKVNLRNAVYDVTKEAFGAKVAKHVTDVFAKGLPSLIGMDMGQRIGAGQIANPAPYVRAGATDEETAKNLIISLLGAPVSMGIQMWDGLNRIADGDVEKGLEKVVPLKAAKDLLRWQQLASEGQKTGTGEVRIKSDQFSTWDLTLRALGVQPMKQSDYYDATNAVNAKQTAASEVHTKLIGEYARAVRAGEPTKEIMRKITAYNRRHPERGLAITMKSLSQAVKGRDTQARQTNKAGVLITPTDRAFEREGRFVGQ